MQTLTARHKQFDEGGLNDRQLRMATTYVSVSLSVQASPEAISFANEEQTSYCKIFHVPYATWVGIKSHYRVKIKCKSHMTMTNYCWDDQ